MAVSARDAMLSLEAQALQGDVRCQPPVRHPFKSLFLCISARLGFVLLWQGFETPLDFVELTPSSQAQILFA